MKYGDVLRWKDQETVWDPEPIGRFMYLSRHHNPNFIEVTCLVAAPDSDWEVGMTIPCNADELELVE